MDPILLAHSNPKYPGDYARWEPLYAEDSQSEGGSGDAPPTGHINRVAALCARFAADAFAASQAGPDGWAVLAGLLGDWHDLGKFSDAFQNYLKLAGGTGDDAHTSEMRGTVDHTSAGAQHAVATLAPGVGALLAYPIAGHHAGLHNGLDAGACLKARLTKTIPEWKINAPLELIEPPPLPELRLPGDPFAVAFAARMLFSCLVDADFLATEGFMNPEQSAQRPGGKTDFAALDRHLSDHLQRRFGDARGSIAEARAEVLAACLAAAEGRPGLYSLTVPTGGGKTLSSLAFALRHAARNGLNRVIYAIPFTSIIEQNAKEFRKVFADFDVDLDALILEHHSNFDPDRETVVSRLASENWDAPIVVTTNVQLFESLFANRTSRCRKLHRIAGSVIVLDEVQTLPVTLLEPCLKVLRVLVEQYGCTVVLCTATQPAIEYREEFKIGLPLAAPIIKNAPVLYRRLKRVDVRDAGTLGCAQLAERIGESEQALAIVSTRRHAVDLYRALKRLAEAEGCFHLSAAVTPEDRSARLDTIRQRLKEGLPCRVVSTQLIEAGVDIDFPVVWRSLAGLDSIAQAAGRCNREGTREHAVTWVFKPAPEEHPIPRGFLGRAADAAAQVIAMGRYDDLLGLAAIEHYFRLHYWQHQNDWDKQKILRQFQLASDRQLPLYFNFATVAEKFRFIDGPQRALIIAHNDVSRALVERLRATEQAGAFAPRAVVRRLQRYTVTVGERPWRAAFADGFIELLHERFAVLTTPQVHYHPELGLQLDAAPLYDPNDTIF